ncbi:unnamed protein product, partial [Echinostoma caproni]|uniref:Biogenesis of lysosome-related organelles complex 1 subunit 1 n=1 Tax=Echinostoma caproni TaxID=27848 RepID=A0A183BC73_9TREM
MSVVERKDIQSTIDRRDIKSFRDDMTCQMKAITESLVNQATQLARVAKSFESIGEAVRHTRDLSKLLLMGGFKLTKWMFNSRHAIDCVPVDERALSLRELQGSPLPTDRAIGVQWDSEKAEFSFQLQPSEKTATRRGILSSL